MIAGMFDSYVLSEHLQGLCGESHPCQVHGDARYMFPALEFLYQLAMNGLRLSNSGARGIEASGGRFDVLRPD